MYLEDLGNSQMSSSSDFMNHIDAEYDEYGSFSHLENCPSLSSSFLTVDTWQTKTDGGRRLSLDSTFLDDLRASSASVTSPITPIGTVPASMGCSNDFWSSTDVQHEWHSRSPDSEALWFVPEEPAMANCIMNSFSTHDTPSQFQPGYFCPGRPKSVVDPPLSRSVFYNTMTGQRALTSGEATSWIRSTMIPQPQTVEPKATFQTALPSSPMAKLEPVTPFRHHRGNSSLLTSSPFSGQSSSVLPSQWDIEDSTSSPKDATLEFEANSNVERCLPSSQESPLAIENQSASKMVSSKSGVDCEAVIPQNSFPCSVPGCIDRNGRPKRFKRQEHRKRHERTVHGKQEEFPCWVITGGKVCGRSFTRRDNLKSHLLKTHGRRSNNQRNSYVATLDQTSKYYDLDWQGRLTAEGLPMGHPQWPGIH